ncbi:MAG: P-II family nitrogen regulator [Lachnospiraceae bacterium]|nr:P-II family nitrogen regulator [Lachnospiraceae bacterium]MBO5145967.1 P-II family nitrogen regulator [Lachnospiraceae bacterium]
MKRLEIVIKPEKLEELKTILDECRVHGVMIANIQGYGNQKGNVQMYRGAEINTKMLPKVRVDTVVDDDIAEQVISRVVKEIQTGNYGDGKIFVSTVEDAVRIRTGEHGTEAL